MLDETEVSFLKKIKEVKFGEWIFYPKQQTICDGKTKRELEPLIFNILTYLILNSDRIITRQELTDNVWKQNYVDDNAINRAISELRKALKSDKQLGHVVKTHYRTGYSFLLDIDFVYYDSEPTPQQEHAISASDDVIISETSVVQPELKPSKIKYYLIGFAIIFLTFTLGLFFYQSSSKVNETMGVTPSQDPLEFSEEILSWEKGTTQTPNISKDHKLLAYAFRPEKSEHFSLRIKNMVTLKEYSISEEVDDLYPVTWAENQVLLYQKTQAIPARKTPKCEVWQLSFKEDIINSKHKKLFDCKTDEIINASITNDSNQLLYTKYNYRNIADLSAIVSRSLSSGTEFQVSSPNNNERGDYFVKLSNQEDRVIFLREQPSGSQIFIADLDGSKQKKLYEVNYKISSINWDALDANIFWLNHKTNSLVSLNLKTQGVQQETINSNYALGKAFRFNLVNKNRFILATDYYDLNIGKIDLTTKELKASTYINSDIQESHIAPFNMSPASIYLLGSNNKSIWLYKDGIRQKLLDLPSSDIVSLAISPDDSKLLVASTTKLFIYQLNNLKSKRTINLDGIIKAASWPLADNILLTYAPSLKTYAWLYNLANEKLTKLTSSQTENALLIDNSALIFLNNESQFIKKNIKSGELTTLLTLPLTSEVIWTADNNYIYYLQNPHSGYIVKSSISKNEKDIKIHVDKDKGILYLVIKHSEKGTNLYTEYVTYTPNYLLDLQLKE